MSFLTRAANLSQASESISNEGLEAFVKSASESDITINDMNMAYNLTSKDVDLYTNEGIIPQDDNIEVSRLSNAVDLMVKQASTEPLTENDAVAYLGEIGLTADDYYEIYALIPEDLIQKVANDMEGVESELTADDAVWDKIAEAHDYLVEAGLNPVESLNFAADFNEAESDEARDKVASETEDLEQEEVDKIAETVEYLSDIEGIHPADLMAEWDEKVAGKMDVAKAGLKKGLGKAGDILSGKNIKRAKNAKKRADRFAASTVLDKRNNAPYALETENARKLGRKVRAAGSSNISKAKLKTLAARGGVGAAAAGGAYVATKD